MPSCAVPLTSSTKLDDEPLTTTRAMESIVTKLGRARRAVVMMGAGCSTSAGIPDFRSKEDGLYSSSTSAPPKVRQSALKGAAMFSADVYTSEVARTQHWAFMCAMQAATRAVIDASASSQRPATPAHAFLQTLKRRGVLLRAYSQNIDGFEMTAGLQAIDIEGVGITRVLQDGTVKSALDLKGKGKAVTVEGDVLQLHGSLHRVKCSSCAWVGEWTDEHTRAFSSGHSVDCPACIARDSARHSKSKRVLPSRSYVRPAIVLYNETSPAAATVGTISIRDLSASPDMLIVAGTSLRIPGFKRLVREFSKAVKSRGGICVFVNREKVSKEWDAVFDYQVLGDCDDFCHRVVTDWKRTRPNDWTTQSKLTQMLSTKQTLAMGDAKKIPSFRSPLRSLPPNIPPNPRATKRASVSESPSSPDKRQRALVTPPMPSLPLPPTSPRTPQRKAKTVARMAMSASPSAGTVLRLFRAGGGESSN